MTRCSICDGPVGDVVGRIALKVEGGHGAPETDREFRGVMCAECSEAVVEGLKALKNPRIGGPPELELPELPDLDRSRLRRN